MSFIGVSLVFSINCRTFALAMDAIRGGRSSHSASLDFCLGSRFFIQIFAQIFAFVGKIA